jgi:hypothetical protein
MAFVAMGVERPALTWSVAVQPDVLAGYADAQSEGSGFLARFLLLVPASNIGKLNYRSEPVPDAVAAEWARVVEGLHAEAWRRYEAMTESLPDDLGPPSSVTFTDDAAELVIQYGERLDREAAHGGVVAHLGGWASKAPARIARVAAVLALAEDPHRRDVRPEHVAAALTLADALTSHASAAFGILRQAARLDHLDVHHVAVDVEALGHHDHHPQHARGPGHEARRRLHLDPEGVGGGPGLGAEAERLTHRAQPQG